MQFRHLFSITAAIGAIALSQAMNSSAQAAVLGSGTTCATANFDYIDCAGAFTGNDKGAKGTGLDNLNDLFGSGWTFAGDNEDGLVSFSEGGTGSKSGTATTELSGFGAIAIKAGKSYSLYTVEDLASFDWSTAGVNTVGKKNKIPALSHVSIYLHNNFDEPPVEQEVPEPGMLLGLAGLAGLGIRSSRKNS